MSAARVPSSAVALSSPSHERISPRSHPETNLESRERRAGGPQRLCLTVPLEPQISPEEHPTQITPPTDALPAERYRRVVVRVVS